MSWVKIDDGFVEHPKVDALSDRAFRLHVAALCYCSRNLTDGLLSPKAVKVLAAIVSAPRVARNIIELVGAGLWVANGDDSYRIHAYLEHNPDAEEVKRKRAEISAKRREAGKKGADARWQNVANDMANGVASSMASVDSPIPSHPPLDVDREQRDSETIALHALRLYASVRDEFKSERLKRACLEAARWLPASEFEQLREYMLEHRREIRHDGRYVTTSLKTAKEKAA